MKSKILILLQSEMPGTYCDYPLYKLMEVIVWISPTMANIAERSIFIVKMKFEINCKS